MSRSSRSFEGLIAPASRLVVYEGNAHAPNESLHEGDGKPLTHSIKHQFATLGRRSSDQTRKGTTPAPSGRDPRNSVRPGYWPKVTFEVSFARTLIFWVCSTGLPFCIQVALTW